MSESHIDASGGAEVFESINNLLGTIRVAKTMTFSFLLGITVSSPCTLNVAVTGLSCRARPKAPFKITNIDVQNSLNLEHDQNM